MKKESERVVLASAPFIDPANDRIAFSIRASQDRGGTSLKSEIQEASTEPFGMPSRFGIDQTMAGHAKGLTRNSKKEGTNYDKDHASHDCTSGQTTQSQVVLLNSAHIVRRA